MKQEIKWLGHACPTSHWELSSHNFKLPPETGTEHCSRGHRLKNTLKWQLLLSELLTLSLNIHEENKIISSNLITISFDLHKILTVSCCFYGSPESWGCASREMFSHLCICPGLRSYFSLNFLTYLYLRVSFFPQTVSFKAFWPCSSCDASSP